MERWPSPSPFSRRDSARCCTPRMEYEQRPLLKPINQNQGLSLLFATLCLIDLFGVFPIIALPGSIIRCDAFLTGWLGIPLALGLFALQMYTAILLGRCWVMAEILQPAIVQKSRFPYAALAEVTLGPKIRNVVNVILDLTVFGGGIPNLLIAAQNLQLFGIKMSCFSFNMPFCFWLLFIGVAMSPMMWLGSPKDMKWVAVTSVITVVTVAALTWSSMLLDGTTGEAVVIPTPTWESVALTYGILAFQFDIHPNILTIQVDMQQKYKLGRAVFLSFLVSGGLSVITTLIALFKYGELARPNLLQGLPGSYLLYINVLLVTVQICLSMVVGGSALFQDVEDKLGIPREFNWKRCVCRTAILMAAVFLAEAVPRFDLIMGLIGAALTGPLMFFLPPLFYIKLSRRLRCAVDNLGMTDPRAPSDINGRASQTLLTRRSQSNGGSRRLSDFTAYDDVCGISWETIFAYAIVALGLGSTLVSTYFGVEENIRFSRFIPSCLQNSTAASDLALFLDV